MKPNREYVLKCRKRAGKYDKKLEKLVNEMIRLGESPKVVERVSQFAKVDAEYCSVMLEMFHDKKMPRYVIDFYEEIYNTVKSVIESQNTENKLLKEYLK